MKHTLMMSLVLFICGCAMHAIKHENDGHDTRMSSSSAAINPDDAKLLTNRMLKIDRATAIEVHSTAFSAGSEIPYKFADYGQKISPPLTWSSVPSNSKSIVLLMEDPDAKLPKPFIHWVLFNLPPETRQLPESVPQELKLMGLGDALQGLNSRGSAGYFGPRPPYADGAHHYHFMIFALDQKLDLLPGTERNTVVKAMDGHILAAGELVGTYKAAK